MPSWGAIAPSASSASTPAAPWGHGSSPVPGRSMEDDEEDDDDEPVRPAHPYTWLQLIVLVCVAFVLGFLIMLLANRDSAVPASGAQPAPASVVQDAADPLVGF